MQERYEQFTQATQQNANLPLDNNDQVPAEFFTAQPSDLSLMDRIAAIFTSPREAMQGIELIPNGARIWFVAILIACAFSATFSTVRYYTTDAVQAEYEVQKEQMEKVLTSKKVPAEQKKAFQEQLDKLSPTPPPVLRSILTGIFFFVLIPFFISALIFYLIGKFAFGNDELSFNSIFIASALTFIISSTGDLVTLVIQSITGDSKLTLSPAIFVTGKLTSPIFTLLSQISLFKILDLFAFGLGYSSLIRRPAKTGLIIVFSTWVLRILLLTGLLYASTAFL